MPKRKKSSVAGNSECSRKKNSRNEETSLERLKRLETNRQRTEKQRSGETSTERQARQATDRRRKADRRGAESTEVRVTRQATDCQRRAETRSAESADDRAIRQATNCQRTAETRSAESAEDRANRQTTDCQRRAETRSAESADDRANRQATDCQRRAETRSAESADDRANRQATDCQRRAETRSAESADDRAIRQATDCQRTTESRSAESADDRAIRQATNCQRTAESRSAESAEVRIVRQACDRQAQMQRRQARIPRSRYIGRRVDEVLDCRQIVPGCNIGPLFDSETGEAKGELCENCSAIKWRGEPKGMCCRSGKVKLDSLFDTNDSRLQMLQNLWMLDLPDSVLFQKNVVALNNALSFASLKVNRLIPEDGRWVPSVVIQGKVAILYGPLRRSDDKPPVFSQLYVLNPDIADRELRLRCGTLYTNDRQVSQAERQQLEHLLESLQTLMHDVSPYVADMKLACEIIDEHMPSTVHLKIDANKRPPSEHARRFQAGYKEISVVMDDQAASSHDIVLMLRGPGTRLRAIPDTNRAVDAWRFPLFFPTGIDGWHWKLQCNQGEIDHALAQAAMSNDEMVEDVTPAPTAELEDPGISQNVGELQQLSPLSEQDTVNQSQLSEVQNAANAENTAQQTAVIEIPASKGRCTGRMFYSYHLQMRHPFEDHFNQLLYGRRLLQEYVCLAAAKIENQELGWIKNHQKQLRADKYRNVVEDLHAHDALIATQPHTADDPTPSDPRLGQLILLPPSHTGSPRFFHKHYQDGLAIVREYKKPDLFITFTCNPQWPEITASLLGSQRPHDRPDLVARVFYQKLKSFHAELIKDQAVGTVAAHLNVVEFQKRGLPHNHMLLILSGDSRLLTAEDVDVLITAELPPNPETLPEGIMREQAVELVELVLRHMVHSCSSQCRPEGYSKEKCTKGFPHEFCTETKWDESAYYPLYRRREGPEVCDEKGKIIDNRWIVPYNAYFLLKYKTHINFECCVSVASVKYLYKYIHKGGDRVMLADDLNEVDNYQNLRSIGASEACWRIFEFPLTARHPAVIALRIHLDQEQMLYFNEDTVREAVEEGPEETELTAFFAYNRQNPETAVKYVDFPKQHVMSTKTKKWKPRKCGTTIGRVHAVHPASGDVFYLRILLHHNHCKSKTSFTDLRTVDNIEHTTFKEACNALGLLQDDGEWHLALAEAGMTQSAYQLRMLFLVMLQFCQPANPHKLFEDHHIMWMDDFKRMYQQASIEELRVMVLLDLEHRLQEGGRELIDYKLPCPSTDQRARIAALQQHEISSRQSVILQEELNFDLNATILEQTRHAELLNAEQKEFYCEIMHRCEREEGGFYFLDARGGTGKTFTLNTILGAVRTSGGIKNVALSVASSGIAAILLSLGRTFHSRFKVPIKLVDENVTFGIKPNDAVAQVLRMSRLIIWDEGPMMHKYLLEGLNRTLQDVTNCQMPFGNKIVIIAGDFRQVLPVIKKGSRAQITSAALHKSHLWSYVNIRHLNQNMRIGSSLELQAFDEHLEQLGNGTLPIVEPPDWVALPEDAVQLIDNTTEDRLNQSLEEFTNFVFPNFAEHSTSEDWPIWVSERAILAPKNVQVDSINERLVHKFPGDMISLCSADSTADPEDGIQFPIEFLNVQTPSGMPPHQLALKKGLVLMLLRNLNPRKGLCNGTRLIVTQMSKLLLHCVIISGTRQGEEVLIPRIELTVDNEDMPLKWKRRQFPVRPAFAMTINKSQGQTLQKVGVWLQDPCFTHGQLYVASSRVGHPDRIKYALNIQDRGLTRNVVYHEALL